MDKFQVNNQRWKLASSPEEAKQAALQLNAGELVVKAQIHAGGRGKGVFNSGLKGGVQLTTSADEVKKLAEKMIGYKLKTKQTTGDGVLVKKLMIAESLNFEGPEKYFAILMDRAYNGPVLVASPMGGMDIEQVAHDTPDQIFKRAVDIRKGVTDEDATYIAQVLKFPAEKIPKAVAQIKKLYQLFIDSDATQVEINPLVEANGDIYCVDAKINFDDNAEFRQKEIYSCRDPEEEDPREVQAQKFNLTYIPMEGNIGCLVNGAGLAMATMDIVKYYGGEPANFLDLGGGAGETQVTEAFKIITSDPSVKAILVNIFGGIIKCDVMATGIVKAAQIAHLKVPLVVRLQGTNQERANQILKESGINVISATELSEAAEKVVACLKK